MKKITILSMLKVWQEYCQTFSCRFKAGFSDFFETSRSTKRLVFYTTLLLLGIGFTSNSYGQLVGSGAVKANFGVDGDAYANFQGFSILFPPITVPPTASPGVDDWFANKDNDSLRVKMPYYTGSGLNVISQLSAGNLRTSVQGNNNFSFTKRQSRPPLTIVNGYLWLDAVYGRDTNSAQGNSDTSIFSSTSDKNSDNPSTWNLGSGSVPQKDDIIDVMAHLRGEGPFPNADGIRPFTTLWAFAAATLRSTNGSKHIDFEFFRTLVDEYQVGDLTFGNTGPQNQGGRTAFTFYTADDPLTSKVELPGEVNVAGCIVVSIDYENGGTKPDVRIRVWMEESVFNTINSLGARPFDVVPGTFEKGELTGNFGYGRITQKSGSTDTDIFGRVNAEGSTLATPWGTLEGPGATFFDEYQTFQHVEIGINLTAFGLDKKNINDPCANILGSLLVKTRSSAGGNSDSFTSELKDFAGPFPFGFTVKPEVTLTVSNFVCGDASRVITASEVKPSGATIKFYGPDPGSLDDDNYGPEVPSNGSTDTVLTRAITNSGYYTAVASVENFAGCIAKSTLQVILNKVTPGVIAGNQTLCSPFDPVAFTSSSPGTGDGTITYQWQMSTTSAVAGFSNIVGATLATYDAPVVGAVTWFRRTATSTLNSVVCSDNSNVIVVTPNAITPGVIAGNQTLCSPFDPSAFTSTTLGSGGGTITYQWQMSTTSAVAGFSNIVGATLATYDAPVVGAVTWFRRTATSTLNSVVCSDNSNVIVVTPNAITPGVIAGNQTLCSPFDPSAFTSTTLGSGGGTITYQWQMSTTSAVAGFSNIVGATLATYDAPVVGAVTWFRRTATSTLNSVVCSDNSNVIVVTPNAITPGVIAGNQTLCSPFDPSAFTSTTLGSGGGTITYQWQMSTTSAVAGFSNIVGATLATYDAPVVGAMTWFRRTATSTLNSVVCSDNSNVIVVTPNAITPGVIAGNQTLCTPADPAAFTSTTPGSGGGAITYQWQMSTVSCDAGFSNIVGATLATYDAPTVSGATYFRRVATSTINGVTCSANSNCLTITPEDINPGEISGSQTLCYPYDPLAFSSVTPGSNNGVISYQWQMSTVSCEAGFSDIIGATLATYDAPAVAVVTYFRRVAKTTFDGAVCSANSNCLTVTPNAITPGVIAGNQTLCSPFDPAAFTSTILGSGGGTITYQWQMSTTSAVAGFSNIVGATLATYDAPVVGAVTWFRRTATSTLNSVVCSDNSNVIVVTPNAITPGVIAGNQTLCSPFDPSAFTSTTLGSGGGTITYQWQMSTTSAVAGFSNIVGATLATYDAPVVGAVTWFRRTATSTLNSVVCSDNSNVIVVTPNAITPGVIAGNQTLCSPFDPSAFTSTTLGSGGGTITYQWQMSTTSAVAGFSNIVGATLATYDAPVVGAMTWFRRTATSTLNSVVCSDNSNVIVVTPNAITPGVIAGNQTLCSPFDPSAFTSTTLGSGGGTITYQWQMSTTSAVAGFSNIVGATLATYDAPVVGAMTWFRRTASSTLNSVVCSDNSNVILVTPNDVVPGSIAGDQKVCVGGDPAAFTSPNAGSGSGTITYQWQSNTTGCESAFIDIVSASSATYDPGVVSVTTYYRRVTKSTLNDVVCYAYSNCLVVTAEICSAALCTYTQGYYGNVGGTSCVDGDQYTTKALIAKALVSYGGTMTVGSAGNTVSIMNTMTDINSLIQVMPGGGGSYVLSGNYSINSLPSSYLKKGRINNTLLAQTIALGLNIGINGALGDFVLQGGKLAVAVPDGGCGTDVAKVRSCKTDTNPGYEYKYYTISAAVVEALGDNPTVQGVYDLANQALGGGSTNGLTLSQIAGMADLINNAFDECRIPVGYGIEPLVCPVNEVSLTDKIIEPAGFTASPVPFQDQLTIRYDFDYVSNVNIEVFDAQGSLVYSKLDTNSYLNKEVVLNLNVYRGQEQVFIVKLTTDRGSSTKKVMSSQ